jgi:hypothetical protein
VEDPQAFSRLDVETADVPFCVRLGPRRVSALMRRSDDHHVPGHRRPRVQRDFARDRIEDLIVVLLEIDDAVLAELF